MHYIAVESESNEYYLFPEEPFDNYKIFRYSWAIERHPRPQLVVTVKPAIPQTMFEVNPWGHGGSAETGVLDLY